MLNDKLQEIIDALGNTPVAEPKIAELFANGESTKADVINAILSDHDLKIKEFNAIEMATFFNEVYKKIFDKKDVDGVFKSTPNTENMEMPDFEEVEDFINLANELEGLKQVQTELTDKLVNGERTDKKGLTDHLKHMEKVVKKLNKLTWKITKLDPKKLTPWEESLVIDQLYQFVSDVQKTALGKN